MTPTTVHTEMEHAGDDCDDYVLGFALETAKRGLQVAVVTLVDVDGSSPWRPGAQMAVSESGEWAGYLSGGCIERAVAAEAVQAMADRRSRRIRYGAGSPYMDIRLPCGSAIELVVDVHLETEELEKADDRHRQRRQAAIAVPDPGSVGPDGASGPFLRRYLPRKRLVVAGIGPIAASLARLSHAAGYEVVLASPDERTLTAPSRPGFAKLPVGPYSDMADVVIDGRTAVALAFHDHEWEANLLPRILASDAFYVGALGSERTHELRIERLAEKGLRSEGQRRIRGPAGLLPHAKGASEISVSILAEMAEAEAAAVDACQLFCAFAGDAAGTYARSRSGREEA